MTGQSQGGKDSDSWWATAVAAQDASRKDVVYEVVLEDKDDLRTETVTAWAYITGFGQDPLVTFWGQDGPVASFNTRYVRQIRIVPDAPPSGP
jgi:hypothetical protein